MKTIEEYLASVRPLTDKQYCAARLAGFRPTELANCSYYWFQEHKSEIITPGKSPALSRQLSFLKSNGIVTSGATSNMCRKAIGHLIEQEGTDERFIAEVTKDKLARSADNAKRKYRKRSKPSGKTESANADEPEESLFDANSLSELLAKVDDSNI